MLPVRLTVRRDPRRAGDGDAVMRVPPSKAALLSLLCVQNRTCRIAEAGHNGAMAETLTPEEFASLLTVGNTSVNSPAPAIPAEHAALLMTLGYMVDLEGRLRMTTPGRIRIYAGQLASRD